MSLYSEEDIGFMRQALCEADMAYAKGEVPVGAVLVQGHEVIGTAHNLRESSKDPSAHAELLAMRAGTSRFDSWRLSGTTLYVTKEPCIMCAGAIINARVSRLVYGCRDAKAGGVNSLYAILNDGRLNHQVEVVQGVFEVECSSVLQRFFRERR
jgi:tRNA(adenine34) deaminase